MEVAEAKVRRMFRDLLRQRGLPDPQIEVTTLSSGGGNYTSALFAATAAEPDTPSIFAKVAILGDKLRKIMNADNMFDTEGIVYNELVNEYDRLQRERDLKVFEFPVMYACDMTRGSETLLLEDLTKEGFHTPSRHRAAEWKLAAAAIAKAADFHALSFALEKHDPEKFQIIAEKVKYKPTENDEESGKELWEKIIGNCVQVVKDEHKQRLVKHMSVVKEEFMSFKRPLNKAVLIHGDYRSSNLLYREQGEDIDIMVVDYQTVHTGSPAADILYFVFMGTDQEFRRSCYQPLLDHYYQRLRATSEKLGVDLTEVYPREIFDSEIKEMLGHALRFSSFILPMVTVSEAQAPLVSGDSDASAFALAPNQLFAERFRGLVSDCVDWGVL